MSFGEWAKHRANQADISKFQDAFKYKDTSQNIKQKNPYSEISSHYKKISSDDIVKEILSVLDSIRSSYSNAPSMSHIDSVLSSALTEISNLRRDVVNLLKQLEDSNKDLILIHVGDEVAEIDGDLATHVITNGVKEYITNALWSAVNSHSSE